MHWVKKATYQNEYRIAIQFEDGVTKMVDLKDYLDKGIFIPLQNLNRFKKFKVNYDTDTIEWENGADLSPDFLYETGKVIEQNSNIADTIKETSQKT
jgi:hypothetical protein